MLTRNVIAMTTAKLNAAIQIGIRTGPHGSRLTIVASPNSAIAAKTGAAERGWSIV